MAFSTGASISMPNVGSGEIFGTTKTVLSETTFEDGLLVGRFAKLDTGSIDNFDGSGTPVVAGVVVRQVSTSVETDGAIDADLSTKIEFMRQGLITVDVKTGESPAKLGRVYISNDGDEYDGLATATKDVNDVDANAEFIMEVQAGVWLIYVTPAPGDVATHIGDAIEAHAASAISLLDSAGLTAQTETEAVIAEILVRTEALIADPGDAAAIPVIRSGNCAITTGGAETRTMAIPGAAGITIDLSLDVYGGNAIVTVSGGVNVTGNTGLTFSAAGEHIQLVAVQVAGALVWRVVANDGVALS